MGSVNESGNKVSQNWCGDLPNIPMMEPFKQAMENFEVARSFLQGQDEYKKMGLEYIRWARDFSGLGMPNVPDLKIGEVTVDKKGWKFFGIEKEVDIQTNAKVEELLCFVRKMVEDYRRANAKALSEQFAITKSATSLDDINPAVARFIANVKAPIEKEVSLIYGLQQDFHFEEMNKWMAMHGDLDSKVHYNRILGPMLPKPNANVKYAVEMPTKVVGGKEVSAAEDFANPFPWFPQMTPTTMWPEGMMPYEVEALKGVYPAKMDDKGNFTYIPPEFLPYTVVELYDEGNCVCERPALDEEDFSKLASNEVIGLNGSSIFIKEIVKGPYGKWYQVTNIAYHPKFRPHFVEIAKIIRENLNVLNVNVGGREIVFVLPPEIMKYLSKVADYIEAGDFNSLLKADLEFVSDELFFHLGFDESYFDDIKYPPVFECGIPDKSLTGIFSKHIDKVQNLENIVASAIQTFIPNWKAKDLKSYDVAKTAQFVWFASAAGLISAFALGTPLGHDYPKNKTPEIDGHRNVIIMDALDSAVPVWKPLGEKFFDKGLAEYISLETITFGTLMHEVTHGIGLKQNDKTQKGETFGAAFGGDWGLMAETYADMGSIKLISEVAREENKGLEQLSMGWLFFQFRRYHPKAKALSRAYMEGDPHGCGSSLAVAWFLKNGAVSYDKKERRFVFNFEKIETSVFDLFMKLNEFVAKGDRQGFVDFYKDEIKSIPDGIDRLIVDIKRNSATDFLIDRTKVGANLKK